MNCSHRGGPISEDNPDCLRSRPWPGWLCSWTVVSTVAAGVLALAWLALRSGTRPNRLAYPCQQAAMGAAAAAFGLPFVAAVLSLRTQLGRILATASGKVAAAGSCALLMLVLAVASTDPKLQLATPPPEPAYRPQVFLVDNARGIEPGRYGGIDDLISLMGIHRFAWHRSVDCAPAMGPNGLIDVDDVVLIKVNGQWSQRGGTNTDVLRGVIRRIVEHPDGFVGEVIVADNGQGWGSLDHSLSNAEDHEQSTQDVVNDFIGEGWNVSTFLWDTIRLNSVGEYSTGNLSSGYIVNADYDPESSIRVSYPKFRSDAGTYVSYKYGIWSPTLESYDADALVVINIPVFKTHQIYGITASVKNHMGVVTTGMSTSSHSGVGRGGLGSVLAEVRMPDLTILDCIWILAAPGSGPSAYYGEVNRRDQLLASTDPVALDMWATKYIMIPQIIHNGYSESSYINTQDPDNPNSVFRRYLDKSMSEMLLAGIDTSNVLDTIDLHRWNGDTDLDGDVDGEDFAEFVPCLVGPGEDGSPGCSQVSFDPDFDGDGNVDMKDIALLQTSFTGEY